MAVISYSNVFINNTSGYFGFRIPSILRARDGSLLAFAEGRVTSLDDDGNIDVVMKRSTDGGVTWGSLSVIANAGTSKFGNPVPILNAATGRIVLHVTRTGGTVGPGEINCGTASAAEARRPFVLTSDNHGVTWSAPVEKTAQYKPSNWRHIVGGPGHGIQLQNGPHAGRMVIAGAHSVAPPVGAPDQCDVTPGAYMIYSDDGGVTWAVGGSDAPADRVIQPNESTIAEVGNQGRIIVNSRDQGESSFNRVTAFSDDGGETFTAPFRREPTLSAPECHCALWRLSAAADSRQRLVFTGPPKILNRKQIVARLSFDGGRSWEFGPVVEEGQGGYSDLAEHNNDLVCIYENGSGNIKFARVPVALLGEPQTDSLDQDTFSPDSTVSVTNSSSLLDHWSAVIKAGYEIRLSGSTVTVVVDADRTDSPVTSEAERATHEAACQADYDNVLNAKCRVGIVKNSRGHYKIQIVFRSRGEGLASMRKYLNPYLAKYTGV